METLRFLSIGIWNVSLLTGLVIIVLFFFWAVTTRAQGRLILGVFPGVTGANILNAGLFSTDFLYLDGASQRFTNLLVIVTSQILFASYLKFLCHLSGRKRLVPVGQAGLVLGWTVSLGSVAVYFLSSSKELWADLVTTVFSLNLVYDLAGLWISATLKVRPNDSFDETEIKRFFRTLVIPLLCFIPVSLFDSSWQGSPHPFGYRYTAGAVQVVVFNLLYFRFFYRWIRFHVHGPAASLNSNSPLAWDRAQQWGLTKREWEIVELLSQGLANKEVAFQLKIDPSTVKNHIFRIYRKVNVQSRVELVNALRNTDRL